MKVKDIISKIIDNYYTIIIETIDTDTNLIKSRNHIRPHNVDDRLFLMENNDLMKMEVVMIVPYFNSLSIVCQ